MAKPAMMLNAAVLAAVLKVRICIPFICFVFLLLFF
jgi:hypothetical protein